MAETGHTGKWLAEQLGKDPATVSKWCTNSLNPVLKPYFLLLNVLKLRLKTY